MPSLLEADLESTRSALPPVELPMGHRAENPSWLFTHFELDSNLLLLDCRPYADYCQAHIEGAVNLPIPSLILRRLKKGNMPISNLLNSETSKKRFEQRAEFERIVIYDESSCIKSDETEPACQTNPVLEFLLDKLASDNKVCYLDGGYNRFEECYPHLCQSGEETTEVSKTVLSLAGLKLVDNNNNNSSSDEIKPLDTSILKSPTPYLKEARLYRPDVCDAVEILQNLYLGSKNDASDWQQMRSKGITHVLNVTDDLPNYFEEEPNMKYLQLPVQDNWSGNLVDLFPKAFNFIDTARDAGSNVLVHCVGGISRSSTVTIAYIMIKHSCSLNDAYDFVKQRKSNVAPNFNFMGQLMDFERSRSFPETPSSGSSVSTLSCSPSFNSDCDISSNESIDDHNISLLSSC